MHLALKVCRRQPDRRQQLGQLRAPALGIRQPPGHNRLRFKKP